MILVTGGTGLVGSHLLYKLAEKQLPVRAIYRSEKKRDLVKKIFSYYSKDSEAFFNSIEWVLADITDIPSLETAFTNVKTVYHCAAFVSFEPDKYYELRKINIEGTANVVNLCIAHQVGTLCYVSSVAALGDSIKNQAITEETEWNPEADNHVYAITKYGAEMEVWRGQQEGLNVIVVNPGVILGPGIWKYGSGSLITTVDKGLKYYTAGSIGLIDVKDVVQIMTQLVEKQLVNDKYLLVAENWSYQSFFNTVAQELGVATIGKEAKPWLLNLVWRLDWLRHKLTGKRRKLTKHIAKSISKEKQYGNKKIKTTLGYEFVPISKSIAETCSIYKTERP
ncbi:MAG TPA: NAD-dependent epimerase/dehydratase family protein [Flavobacteriaceae bacterium]|nr:NAD-dependent epimerase/dehydratase family protein [Flavobacteriaceae bacterium]